MDFTPQKYRELVETLLGHGYQSITYADYCQMRQDGVELPERFVILRHDVDLHAKRSAVIAKIEAAAGAKAVYYFRVIPESNQPDVINEIAGLGHEIGYHYEDMTICNGDDVQAFSHFCKQLGYFRKFYPVKTICMHGSPRSQYDAKDLWKSHSFSSLQIIGEPYLTTDFEDVFYLTDTGRCWDGAKFSVRDKVEQPFNLSFHTTDEIIRTINENKLPQHLMITTHPQRWIDAKGAWVIEWVKQNLKNQIKRIIIKQ